MLALTTISFCYYKYTETFSNFQIYFIIFLIGCAGKNRTSISGLWAERATVTPPHDIIFLIIEMLYILWASYLQLVCSPTIIILLKERYIVVFIYIQIYGKKSKIQNIFLIFFLWRWRDSNPRPNTDLITIVHKLSTFFLMYKIYSLYFPA